MRAAVSADSNMGEPMSDSPVCCSVAARSDQAGLSDVFNLVVRPNPVLAPRDVYESKSARWRQQWPELTVLDWPTVP